MGQLVRSLRAGSRARILFKHVAKATVAFNPFDPRAVAARYGGWVGERVRRWVSGWVEGRRGGGCARAAALRLLLGSAARCHPLDVSPLGEGLISGGGGGGGEQSAPPMPPHPPRPPNPNVAVVVSLCMHGGVVLPVCLSACLPACLPVCRLACLPVCLPAWTRGGWHCGDGPVSALSSVPPCPPFFSPRSQGVPDARSDAAGAQGEPQTGRCC